MKDRLRLPKRQCTECGRTFKPRRRNEVTDGGRCASRRYYRLMREALEKSRKDNELPQANSA